MASGVTTGSFKEKFLKLLCGQGKEIKSNPFVEREGSVYVLHDALNIKFKDNYVIVTFRYKGEDVYTMDCPSKLFKGDELNIVGLEGQLLFKIQ